MFIESLNFFWQAERSQIYRVLNIMKKWGWLSSEIVFQTDRPNKKLYTISDVGKSEFLNLLSTDCIDEALFTRNQLLLR
ncbi:PadR family transcriptional regulator, partial [Vallitalea maricola]|uniref:PadR family transcriptional regulator n=1 Tax=Vallitalea maricola TaxID=3074433 RepID=UPI003365B136